MTRIRMVPDDRRRQYLEAGLVLMRDYGVKAVTRVALAAETGTTDGLINRYFGNREGLRTAIMVEAVGRKDAKVLSEAYRAGYVVEGVPRELDRQARALIRTPELETAFGIRHAA